jgi:hypothetical protein
MKRWEDKTMYHFVKECVQFVSAIDCEFHVLFQCSKYNGILTSYLNWYSNGITNNDFYLLINSQSQETIFKLSVCVSLAGKYEP